MIQTYEVAGMTCAGCARALEKTVAAIAGVRAVSVEHNNGVLRIETNTKALADDVVKNAVDECGFTLRSAP